MNRVFGDSFTNPGYGATANHSYLPTLTKMNGLAYINLGINGAQVADQITNVLATNVVSSDTTLFELGTNDHYNYGNDATKRQ